jgi:nicotinic acid mononucleotide adenylyltransferase
MQTHASFYYLIPGSFRPPHRGHYEMIRHFINLAKTNNGKVIVFISNPSDKNTRTTSSGVVISPQFVKQRFERVFKNNINISFIISDKSPVSDCYEFGNTVSNSIIVVCCGNKGNDLKRFSSIEQYYNKKFPNNNVLVEPFAIKTNISSSSIRLRL